MFSLSVPVGRVALSCLLLSSLYTAVAGAQCQRIIYQAKEIITMEPGWPSAKYVLVQGDTIKATTNTLEQLKDYHVPKNCIDSRFKDQVIVPGFIEAHSHTMLGGMLINAPTISATPIIHPDGSRFNGVNSPEQALELIKHYVKSFNKPEETLIIWGWDVVMMGGLHLDKYILNQISTSQPFLVWDSSEHFFYANDAAMTQAKLMPVDLSINGVISENKQFTGQFLGPEAGKRILAGAAAKILSPDYALPRMKSLLDLSAKNGITTSSELGLGIFDFSAEKKLLNTLITDQSNTRLVVTTYIPALLKHHKNQQQQAIDWVVNQQKQSNDFLIYQGVKLLFDDSFLGLKMMEKEYLDGRKGLYIVQPGDDIYQLLAPWWQANVPIHVHSNGTEANENLAETLWQLQLAMPRFAPKFIIEHAGMTTTASIEKVQQLGAMASVNPYYVYYRSDVNSEYLGSDRSAKAARLKTMVDSGMTVSLHSDTPIGPPAPLEWMWIATNRLSLSGQVKAPAERVSRATALKMVTINAAKTLGIEDKVGSIEPGKKADFTILAKNPLKTDPQLLRDIDILATVVGGKVITADDIKIDRSLIAPRMPVDLTEFTPSQATNKQWQTWHKAATKRQARVTH
jgi:predicted amidohydrolase YtcJ